MIINKDKKYYDIEMCFYILMYNILLNIIILKLNKNEIKNDCLLVINKLCNS